MAALTALAAGAMSGVAVDNARADVTIVPTAQCRGTGCLVQVIFTTPVARIATVTGGGTTAKIRVRPGTTRRLAQVTGPTATFPVTATLAGDSATRRVRRREMAINGAGNTCARLTPTAAHLSVGPTSGADRSANIPSTGAVKIAVVFVDFPDAPATRSTNSIVRSWLTTAREWLTLSSYGRVSVDLSPRSGRWLRMPRRSSAYNMSDGVTFDDQLRYLKDVMSIADPIMDFSGVDGIYVIPSGGADIQRSPTFRGARGTFVADGQPLGPAVTFGVDAYTWGGTIVPHETGHMFGLPDLYDYDSADQHRFTGVWDYMGDVFDPTDLTAWQRRKLDWLDPGQVLCAGSTGISWAVLAPLGRSGGSKSLFLRTSRFTGIMVENRQRVGNDQAICRTGALVYSLDSRIASGAGPIRVVGGDVAGLGCGYGGRSDAPLRPGQSAARGRVTVRVLGAQGGRLEVSVSRR